MGIKKQLNQVLPLLAILAAVFLWGSSFSATRILLMELPPFTLMFFRYLTAFIIILPISGKILPRSYGKGDWKILVPMVLFQPCLYFFFETRALMFTTSAQAGVISACLPLMVAVAAWFFLSEQITGKTIGGLVLSISGVILLTAFQDSDVRASHPVLGNMLELMAMASACGYMILVKQLSSRYSTWTLTGMQVIAGLLFFSPGIRFLFNTEAGIWNLKIILLVLYLGSCVSFLAFGFYNWGISKIAASKAAVFINLVPVITVILGWLVLDETLNLLQMTGGAVVIAGVVISNQKAS